MTTPISFGPMYHTGIVVKDVDAAMAEYRWCDDLAAATAGLVRRGVPIAAKVGVSEPDEYAPIVLFQAKSGIYLELISSEFRSVMFPQD